MMVDSFSQGMLENIESRVKLQGRMKKAEKVKGKTSLLKRGKPYIQVFFYQ